MNGEWSNDLVGGFNSSEKYEFVSWDSDIPKIWKNKIHVPNLHPDNDTTRRIVSPLQHDQH